MTRIVTVIAITVGMALVWGFLVPPGAAELGFVWGTAELIETDMGNANVPHVAMDPHGNAVVVWRQWDGTRGNIWANRFVPGVGWGTAELIETDDTGGAGSARVAVDPQGHAVAVWEQLDGIRYNIWANRFVPGLGWGTVELLETNDVGFARSPQVAVDLQGNATVVWRQDDATRYNIWANRFVSGVGWGTAELIETDEGDAGPAHLAVDLGGIAVAVWNSWDGTRNNIWANRFVPSVGWGTAEMIETAIGDALFPKVVVDPQGNATVVWHQDDGTRYNIWANRFVPGVGWGAAELIEFDDAGNAEDPQVAVDLQGSVTAVWVQDDGTRTNIRANRFVPGIGWGTAEPIETKAGFPHSSHVAVDPRGNVLAVWSHFGSIWANRFVPGAGWASAEEIETERITSAPQVTIDTQGNAVLVWLLHDGIRNNIWAKRGVEDSVNPIARAGQDQTAKAGDTVSFDAGASSDNMAIVSYEWDFGDETTGTGETATHSYTDPGTYTVTLTVRDAAGNADMDSLTVTVEVPPGFEVSPTVLIVAGVGGGAAAAVAAFLLWRRRRG